MREQGPTNEQLSNLLMNSMSLIDELPGAANIQIKKAILTHSINTMEDILQHSDKFVIQDHERIEALKENVRQFKEALKKLD